jgi:acyl carrier protein
MGGDRQLVAYVVTLAEANPEVLREFMKASLPPYMVPAHLVMLSQFPLTAHGKIDERKLPAPDTTQISTTPRFVSPRNDVERRVAALWSEVLGRSEIGVHDNFFDLGGHSLLATQAIARIREAFKVNVPLRALFERPTVAGLAEVLRDFEPQTHEAIPAIKRLPRG